ncbi:response regulator transcription factor [Nocardia sp. NBC_00416]|uniref:response regulator transcription factor n=1 Tax=Nocardia sp. NBC_00416 TaxID=2975991 RepID=UPI002E219A87
MSGARVLVIEDTETIRVALSTALTGLGFEVHVQENGYELEYELDTFRPDVVILDVMLPGRDGFALLQVVREMCTAGVLLLTARESVGDRLRGLDTGADDYVTKPFVLAEVIARVNAILRRIGRTDDLVHVGDLVVNSMAGTATRNGCLISLTATEFKLLTYLTENHDRVVHKKQILAAVWGYEDYNTNLVDVFISMLRRKLESQGPRLIHTVHGRGFILQDRADFTQNTDVDTVANC